MATLFEMLQARQPATPSYGGNAAIADAADVVQALPQQPLMRPTSSRERSRGPSLLDTIWGVAAGYSPGATRQMHEQRDLSMRADENELATSARNLENRDAILSQITDPRERAVAMANMAKWGENAAQRYGTTNLSRGGVLASGTGEILAANPYTHISGDEIIGVGPQGANRIYTREAESIDEQIKRDRNRIDEQLGVDRNTIAREGLDVQRRGQDIQLETAGMSRDDKLAEANEATRAELSGYQGIGRRIDDMILATEGGNGQAPKFEVGPLASARYESELAIGRPSPEAAAYGLFRTNVQQIVNESLRLNTGVQTEGDAKREAESIMRNIHNPAYVSARLKELKAINERAVRSREEAIQRRESRMSRPPASARSPSRSSGPIRVTSAAQARALPSGTEFITPDGRRMRVR